MKMEVSMTRLMLFALSAMLTLSVVSCGSDDDDDGGGSVLPEQQVEQGVFRAELSAENPDVTQATGTAEITIQDDTVDISVAVNNAPNTVHPQHIHTGTRCPALPADDTNNDGVIDAAEAEAVYGPPMLALDSNLTNADEGSFESGANYNYTATGNLLEIITALNVPALGLEGKVVNIHGVSQNEELPEGITDEQRELFPIACGVLTRVESEEPGGTTGGTTAGTDGGAEGGTEGGTDGGTDDGTTTDPGTTTVGTGGL